MAVALFWFAMRVIWSGISIVLYEAIGKTGKTYGGYLTDYTFNGIIAGRRGTAQDDDISALNRIEHVRLAVSVDMMGKTQICQFINTSGEVVPVYNPFVEGSSQTEILLNMKN